MNKLLQKEIVNHIFSALAIIPSDFINFDKTKSLIDKEFLLKETLSFEDENGSLVNNKLWGCQLTFDGNNIKIILGDCSLDKDLCEYALIVYLKDSPTYGIYYSNSEYNLIACSLNGNEWLQCNTYLQATFLAGMENLKDIGLNWSKCTDYTSQIKMLQKFINYYNSFYEVENAGKES